MTETRTEPAGIGRRSLDKAHGARERVRSTATGRLVWRGVIVVLGVCVIAVGVLLLALPGPGWLIIFAGLGILASEFEWAARLLGYAREQVRRWTEWARRRGRPVQALLGLIGLLFLGAVLYVSWLVYF